MDPFFSPNVQAWFETLLMWVGFGTCVGLLAKALMPGRDPGGAVATLLMGITGVVIGCGVYTLVYNEKISPITSVGLICGTIGAFVILLFYRLLGGFILDEAGSSDSRRRVAGEAREPVRRRRRRRYSYYLDP
ncbi:MAG: GlsB/YeaQ/YmgE family stress response membrane protein [Planctomycetales bacterium]|nr:GlsB/YeaQ/YmgE family stress response membrane protein [Planctomycetales bacterium]MCA9171106.1 GlsB/YeaQ/YmgE family stress response membrane protein [Planctomycetales bacterium]